MKPIVIQGAMDIEIEYLLEKLSTPKKSVIGGSEFYEGDINGRSIVLSKTGVGIVKASLATTAAILHFGPSIVINQGTAGSHASDIHIGDIIIGEKVVNINSFKTLFKRQGKGSVSLDWIASDWATNSNFCDSQLLEIAKKVQYSDGKVYAGTIGSGDIWNKEIDRINWIHEHYSTLCEDMESIATYNVCHSFNLPCIGVRIISNNEMTGQEYDENISIKVQKFVLDLVNRLESV